MIIDKANPTQVVLEVAAFNQDGSIKTDLSTHTVRVYSISGGVEVLALAPTNLIQVGSTNIFRYIWTDPILPAGHYVAEYTLTDSTPLTSVSLEDINIGYLEADITTIKDIETGKWEIVANQLILSSPSNVELARFNLYDIDGKPTMDAVVKRVRV